MAASTRTCQPARGELPGPTGWVAGLISAACLILLAWLGSQRLPAHAFPSLDPRAPATAADAPAKEPAPQQPDVEQPASDKPVPQKSSGDKPVGDKPAGDKPPVDKPQKVLLRGEVVLLVEALRQRGVKTYGEEIAQQAVLRTSTGELIPLVPDWRGRAFSQDERLRGRPVELVVNRRVGVPWVSVLSIYGRDDAGQRSVIDYWCDVCAIPMYEIKDCECCQGPIRLRFRPQSLPRDVPPAPENSLK